MHDSTALPENKSEGNKLTMATSPDLQLIEKLTHLPDDFWDFKESDTQALTHGLHTYPATMIYPISRNILSIMTGIKPISSLMDPFAGSGTVLVEGVLANIKYVYGNDINPLSTFLCEVKTTPIKEKLLSESTAALYSKLDAAYKRYNNVITEINDYMESYFQLDLTDKNNWGSNAPHYLKKYYEMNDILLAVPEFKNIGYWFKPNVIIELQIIKDAIKQIQDLNVQKFMFVAFSECIRLVSNRRNGEFKMFRMNPEKVREFEPKVRAEFFKLLERNIKKMQEFTEQCEHRKNTTKVVLTKNNSKSLVDIPDESIDIVITSPPYGDSRTTVAYGEFSRLSLQWLDIFEIPDKEIMSIDKSFMGGMKYRNGFEFDVKSKKLQESLNKIQEIDIERAGDVYSFYSDLNEAMASIASKCRHGSYQFWVVGNRTVKGEKLKTDEIIAELAQAHNLEHVYTIGRNIHNKVMPSKNSPSNKAGKTVSTMVNEHIVILRKK